MTSTYPESAIRNLDRGSVLCVAVAIGLIQWLNGLWGGFMSGAALGNYRRPVPQGKMDFGISDSSDPLSSLALYSAIGILIYTIIKLIEGKTLLQMAALIPLFVSAYLLWEMNAALDLYASNPDAYFDLLRQTRLEQIVVYVAFSAGFLLHLASIVVRAFPVRPSIV